jgi:RNA polymerase sigma-70 factor (ECF subfamily)
MKRGVVTAIAIDGYHKATMTDASLVRAVLDGNVAAFTTLVDRHSRVCLRFATRMLGNPEDAEDVTQEAFLRAYGALGRYDERVTFRTWIMSILINRCRTALGSRRKREARVILDDSAIAVAAMASGADDLAMRDALERALAQLDDAHREAFLLKHVEQLGYDEMATVTGAGVSALKMRVRRACERLQILLEDDRND